MDYQGGVAPQREATFLERRRPHHALCIIAESRRFLRNAEGARVQRPVFVQVLEEGKSVGTFRQTFARHGDSLVFYLHTKTREGFLQEIIRRGIEGDIEKALRTVDVARTSRVSVCACTRAALPIKKRAAKRIIAFVFIRLMF